MPSEKVFAIVTGASTGIGFELARCCIRNGFDIFEAMGKPPRGKTCDAIIGIIEEGKEIMEDYAGDSALDAGLAALAQAVEHYEIARYGTLRTWADELGMKDAALILEQTLQEEIKTDQLLTQLATSAVNRKAA